MDSKPPLVKLPNKTFTRCPRFGCDVVDDYRKDLNGNSLVVSSHGAEADAFLQAQAKMGECAFCSWAGLSYDVLNWRNRPEDGFDDVIGAARLDVKPIEMNRPFVIWPINKRTVFDRQNFDSLVLVKVYPPAFLLAGHIAKHAFCATAAVGAPLAQALEIKVYLDRLLGP
jgi:hypothetical protein